MSVYYNSMAIDIREAVIDTGCNYSLISYKDVFTFPSDADRLNAKKLAIQNNKCVLGYGIETPRSVAYNLSKMTLKDKIECKNLKTIEKLSAIRLNGVPIGDKQLQVSYNYDCPSLLGMEII